MIISSHLSSIENLSCTLKLTELIASVNQSNYLFIGTTIARISGAVAIPFSSLLDATAHTALCGGKIVTGILISPYNSVAMVFFPNWSAPKDLELSSAFIHLICTIECIVAAALLPFVCLVNPKKAHEFMNSRYANKSFQNNHESEARQFEVQKVAFKEKEQALETQNALLQARLNELEQRYANQGADLIDKDQELRLSKEAKNQLQEDVLSLQAARDSSELELQAAKQKVGELESSMQNLQTQLRMTEEISREVVDLREAIRKQAIEREGLVRNAEEVRSEKDQLERRMQTLQEQLLLEEEKVENFNQETARLRDDIEKQMQAYRLLEKAIQEKGEENIANLVIEKDLLERKLQELQTQLTNKEQKIKQMDQEIILLKEKLEKELIAHRQAEQMAAQLTLEKNELEKKGRVDEELLKELENTSLRRQQAIEKLLNEKVELEKGLEELERLLRETQQKLAEKTLEDSEILEEDSDSEMLESYVVCDSTSAGFFSLVPQSSSKSVMESGEEVESIPNYLPERESGFEEQSRQSSSLSDSITQHVANGKVKDVWVKTNRDPSIVYYTGQGSSAEAELKEEVKTAQAIRTALKQLHPELKEFYLAVDIKETAKGIKDPKTGERLYTVECKKADGDLEKILTKRKIPLSFDQRLELGRQALTGLSYLQEAGYVQGDLKPENILVYLQKSGEILIGISDFGKAKLMGPDHAETIRGNPRFAPPEFETSHKGEVFGGAMILIRILEEEFLDDEKTYLMEPYRKKAQGSDLRRGVEKYLLENGKCKQVENWVSWGGFGVALKVALKEYIIDVGNTPNAKAEGEIHKYVDELTRLMAEKIGKQKAESLNTLLKAMTRTNPDERPSMSEAATSYAKFLGSQSA